MDNQRNMIMAVILSALVLFGWSSVADRFFPTPKPAATATATGAQSVAPGESPSVAAAVAKPVTRSAALASGGRVQFSTPSLKGSINLKGAQIDDLVLVRHRQSVKKDAPPVTLLSPAGTKEAYFSSFGWVGDAGLAVPDANTVWTADKPTLAVGQPVTLLWSNATGQTFSIRFSVDENYLFTIDQSVANAGPTPVTARNYALVSRAQSTTNGNSSILIPGHDTDSWTHHIGPIGAFNGAANFDVNYPDLDELGTKGQRFQSKGGWIGFGETYWLTALAPANNAAVDTGFVAGNSAYQGDWLMSPQIIQPGKSITNSSHFFAGAKEVAILDQYEEKLGIAQLGRSIDWGWFEVIEKPIFYLLDWLFDKLGNFGAAIIVLTFIVRGIMFPIAQKQFASMAAMRAVQPKMKVIQERYKDDKQRQQQEMMQLYKDEKINPLSGCLPIFLQIPIFYALYKVLMVTIEMRHQPFIGWIKDLSAPDPLTPVNLFGLLDFAPPSFLALGILPILLGITMWLQFKLNPAAADPVQQQVFSIMPWIMMFMMAPFASGLQLYWVTSNILTIAQQKWLYSRHPALREPVVK